MTEFDPAWAKEKYASLDVEELIRIAYLEPDYLAEAKEVALAELGRRGVLKDKDHLIERVRVEMASRVDLKERQFSENLSVIDDLKSKVLRIVFICAAWVFALVFPFSEPELKTVLSDWKSYILFATWLVFAVEAFQMRHKDSYRQMYLLVVIPCMLLLASTALNAVK